MATMKDVDLETDRMYIRAPSKGTPFTIREVKASHIGQLVRISGIVTRCSDVKPLMQVAVYTRGFEIYQALARLPFSETVAQSDVDEALRLTQMSKFSLYSDERQRAGLDAIFDIYSILRGKAARNKTVDIGYADAFNWISRKGYSEAELK